MPKLKAVFFDFDNTLVDYVSSDIVGLTALLHSVREIQDLDIDAFVEVAVSYMMEAHNLIGKSLLPHTKLHHYRLRSTLASFGVEWTDQYLDTYWQAYTSDVSVFTGARETLSWLQNRVSLAMLSNAYDAQEQRERIAASGLAQFFSPIIVCSEIGYYKPDTRAFQHLVDACKLCPANCLFIGDSEEHDIKGAKDAGLLSIKLVHQPNRSQKPTAADYVCHGFAELACLLRELIL